MTEESTSFAEQLAEGIEGQLNALNQIDEEITWHDFFGRVSNYSVAVAKHLTEATLSEDIQQSAAQSLVGFVSSALLEHVTHAVDTGTLNSRDDGIRIAKTVFRDMIHMAYGEE